jgi:hypothetical protein
LSSLSKLNAKPYQLSIANRFYFPQKGDEVVLPEQQNQLLLLIASALWQTKFDGVTYYQSFWVLNAFAFP